MKKISSLLLICLLIANFTFAQKSDFLKTTKFNGRYTSWEIGLQLGESHYYGDLSTGPVQFKNLHKDWGAFLRYQFGTQWAFKLVFNNGLLSGNDAISHKVSLRSRNLNFYSPLYEGALMAEYMYPKFSVCGKHEWCVYATGGIAVFHFQPQSAQAGLLRPLSTEGQGTSEFPDRHPYLITQPSIPVGLGVKYHLWNRFIIGAEVALRKTFTDYIDDVSKTYPSPAILEAERGTASVAASYHGKQGIDPTGKQRGNPISKDMYCIAVVQLSYVLTNDCISEAHKQNDVGGCKTF